METKIKTLYEVEKDHILQTLADFQGDILKTARVLMIGKTTLYRKLKQWNIPTDYGWPAK